MAGELIIARATLADAPAVAEIYAHHVLHGTATFEIVPPGVDEIAARMSKVLGAGWPWLIARDSRGEIVGYAYAAQMAARAAYRYAGETSIYLRHDRLGQGIGGALLAALLEACEACGFRQVVALIAGTQPASAALHARAGFVEVGRVRSAGRKHGQWIDVVTMHRALGAGAAAPPEEEPQ
jgi:phosphinothricin acetyltransferase